MDDDNDDYGKVIEFPGTGPKNKASSTEKSGAEERTLVMTKESVTRLVKALATIHLATTYRAKKNDQCKENIKYAQFPCKLNCACYVNICAAMGLESFLGGEAQEEAILLVEAEHELIKSIYENLPDEDDDD